MLVRNEEGLSPELLEVWGVSKRIMENSTMKLLCAGKQKRGDGTKSHTPPHPSSLCAHASLPPWPIRQEYLALLSPQTKDVQVCKLSLKCDGTSSSLFTASEHLNGHLLPQAQKHVHTDSFSF